MKRCALFSGSITGKCSATATRISSLHASHKPRELRTRWELPQLNSSIQHRGFLETPLKKSEPWLSHTSANYNSATPLAAYRNTAVPVGRGPSSRRWNSEASSTPSVENGSVSNDSPVTLEASTVKPPSDPKIEEDQDLEPTFKRRPLPVPPLMNPAFLKAREKHKLRKPRPSKEPTDFQRQLAKNPYALALATPIRRCLLTNVKLPAYFLQDFMVMLDPLTEKPWYVPASLSDKHQPRKDPPSVDTEDESGMDIGNDYPQHHRIGFKVYTLNSKVTIDAMQDMAGYKRNTKDQRAYSQQTFVPPRMREFKSAVRAYATSKWRPDMGDFVFELMGRRMVSALKHLWGLKRGYLVGCTDWDDALKKPQIAAVLWLGKAGDEEAEGPPEFATLDVGTQTYDEDGPGLGKKKRKVPVFNLKTFLETEKLAELRALAPKSELLVLKHKNATVEMQSRLWKLQGYMARHQ
ncbi:uncharacterized protein L3040_001041 [Drepanopeziza brunnea f. sp. 'multigermtubi']|uniref:Esterase-like protein n=1 Tax=Marssonina brunnea f. sp. multigermtubi (strain MB_m1) TaxID=1072389 RepID=K1XIW8_MARBU|nr:Esterase-like protein [Drepanopeziza brunnea f. sp. 'multigermtubi' MB_m1]EKD12429.1 Esterase-like protein [Drepanopeziza brunnea f. sp. 'multigermtubi' MB_m1]KAJ5054777.1 hypothetical protein L3040_001041 [Drepanopeziza brunnea f. sp. 'multigermtubi']